MASRQSKEPQVASGIVKVQRYQDGKKSGEPEFAAAGVKWVVDGLDDGTVKLVEEVPADASQVPASGDATTAGAAGSS